MLSSEHSITFTLPCGKPSPHCAGHKAESTHLFVWPRWELPGRAGGGTCKQASPIQTCTTSLQQKFLPWRDFNRIYRVHILKCILGPKQLPTLSELFSNKASNKAYEIQQKSYKNVFYRTPWLMTFTIPFLTVTSLCISKTQYILWNLSQKSPHKIHVIYIGHSTSATLKLEISRFRS